MIRTEAVRLASINGLAYKQKLPAGGAGIAIITPEDRGAFTVNKRNGSAGPHGHVNEEVFTAAVVAEALELTRGLPYKHLGKITKVYADNHCDETAAELEAEDDKTEIEIIGSVEYTEFIAQYTDKSGKFSYQLMNKELMQFAARSNVVSKMLTENANVNEIVRYVVRSKAALLAHSKGMDEDKLTAFIDTFDSMNTRSAFKELNSYLRGRFSRNRK